MTSWGERWRMIAGIALLAILVVVAVRLIPPYFMNLEFQRFLDDTVRDAGAANVPVDVLQVRVLDRARRMGLPVKAAQVHATRAGDALAVEVRYSVPVDFSLYTVDLHFRPRAGN